MKLLRKLSLPRLLAVVAVVVAIALGGTAIAIAARGGAPTPPPKPLARAIHDSLAAPDPSGITARIKFTNKLFPSGALEGKVGSALMSGAGGRLWLTSDGRGRLELQSTAGDVQIVWNAKRVTVYDASSNTVYTRDLPKRKAGRSHESKAAPSIAEISDFLSKISDRASVSSAQPTNVAGRPAYAVSISPQHDGGLLGSVHLAWDAGHGVPLRVAIYAQGASKPVLALEATDISYGPVPAANVDVSPPAGAKKSSLGAPARTQEERGQKERGHEGAGSNVSGLAAVKAAAGFKVVAPDTLVGLPRKAAQLVGGQVSKTALLVYGEGLGAIVLAESPADSPANRGPLASLPTVSLDGATGHELATELGTALAWRRNRVAYVLAGSLPPAAAEAAARSLK